jgi:signal transduction histidine kinase
MKEKPVAGAVQTGRRLLAQRPVVAVAVLFLAAVAATLAHVRGLQDQLLRTQALQNAELFTEALAEFRTFYTSEVVERIRPRGIEIRHDYLAHEGAAPLPATLSMLLGNRIEALGSGLESRLYSAYPFPWATEDGGFADDFGRAAWEALTQNPEEPFTSFEMVEEREVLRYATADLMRPECLDCHNTRPDSPKTDWKVGDVRGVLEVITPLDASRAATRSGLADTAILMVIMAAMGLLILGMVMSDLQEATHQTVALTEETRRAHEQEQMATDKSEHLAREKVAADAANRAKSAFLADMSHEIRTPMSAIVGFAHLLEQDSTLGPEQKDQLKAMRSAGDHLVMLIDDVLAMSRLEAGRSDLNPTFFDPRTLLEELETIFRLKARQKKLTLSLEIDPTVPDQLQADQGKLRQILMNVVDNAVKFTERGSVTIRAHSSGAEESRMQLVVEVEDTGVGIADDQFEKLFEEFSQLGSETHSKPGTGLGMAISRRLARAMGGDLTMTSQLGEGSVFRLEIPVETAK